MENPRPEKVAVVDEVRETLRARRRRAAHRVPRPQGRGAGRAAHGDRARPAASTGLQEHVGALRRPELDLELDELLTGPTALAFVSTKADGTPGDVAAVAKALQDFAKGNPLLVLKGGVLGEPSSTRRGEGARLAADRSRDLRPFGRRHQQRRPWSGRGDQRRAPQPRLRAPGRDRRRRVRRRRSIHQR